MPVIDWLFIVPVVAVSCFIFGTYYEEQRAPTESQNNATPFNKYASRLTKMFTKIFEDGHIYELIR